jgi:hypothetical protein
LFFITLDAFYRKKNKLFCFSLVCPCKPAKFFYISFISWRENVFFVIFFVLFLCSCSNDNDYGTPEVFGWRSAGLVPNLDSLNKWGNGFMEIAHSGKYIFVKDGKVSNTQTLGPDNRIFMSMQGSSAWEELQKPDGVVVYTIMKSYSACLWTTQRN